MPSLSCKANTSCPPELGLHPWPHSQGLRENFRLSGTERLTEGQIHVQIFWKLHVPRRAQGAKEVPGSGETQQGLDAVGQPGGNPTAITGKLCITTRNF